MRGSQFLRRTVLVAGRNERGPGQRRGVRSRRGRVQPARRFSVGGGTLGIGSVAIVKVGGRLATNWPDGRLIEVWNSIPGVSLVKKFTDRKSAVSRIWKAIQSLTDDDKTEAWPGAMTNKYTGRYQPNLLD